MLPRGPVRHQVGISDQDFRRVSMGLKYNHGLARLHQQGFILLQVLERFKNRVECLPRACRLAAPTVDDELFGLFGHIRVEVVLDHTVGGFAEPVFASELCAARRADDAGIDHVNLHIRSG